MFGILAGLFSAGKVRLSRADERRPRFRTGRSTGGCRRPGGGAEK